MIEIPVYQNKSSKFNFEIILDNRLIALNFYWNIRSSSWYLDVTDAATGDSVVGLKITENWLLLRQFKAFIPNITGDFIVKKLNTDEIEITYDNLGVSFKFFYATEEETIIWELAYGVR